MIRMQGPGAGHTGRGGVPPGHLRLRGHRGVSAAARRRQGGGAGGHRPLEVQRLRRRPVPGLRVVKGSASRFQNTASCCRTPASASLLKYLNLANPVQGCKKIVAIA